MSEARTILDVSNLSAWYGESHILHGMTFRIGEGEVVSLLGRNGAGKTTTLRAIMGLVDGRKGAISLNGRETISLPPEKIARLGAAYCPEERGIFASLTVEENLLLPPQIAEGGMRLDDIYALFPNLKERLSGASGARLSGGEQQMLAIGRILRTGARLILLDEPTEGLAPVIVKQIGNGVRKLRQMGFTILLVEQNFRFAARLADRHYVVEHGRVAAHYTRADLDTRMGELTELLGV